MTIYTNSLVVVVYKGKERNEQERKGKVRKFIPIPPNKHLTKSIAKRKEYVK